MTTITLNKKQTYSKNSTSSYWRELQCNPQTVELKTWSINHPFFILKGVVINSHDPREIGKEMEVHVQTYSFWLNEAIESGIYTIK